MTTLGAVHLARHNALNAPIGIYEVHLGSWMRPRRGTGSLSYRGSGAES